MAHIYGRSGAEKDILRLCPADISCFDDIKLSLVKYENDLKKKKNMNNHLLIG